MASMRGVSCEMEGGVVCAKTPRCPLMESVSGRSIPPDEGVSHSMSAWGSTIAQPIASTSAPATP